MRTPSDIHCYYVVSNSEFARVRVLGNDCLLCSQSEAFRYGLHVELC